MAIAGAVFSVAVHTVVPRIGRGLQDALSVVKLFTLFFIVCCGFAALGGHLKVENKPHNFTNAFEGTSHNGYNIGSAILNVIFSFQGYDNVNAVSFSFIFVCLALGFSSGGSCDQVTKKDAGPV